MDTGHRRGKSGGAWAPSAQKEFRSQKDFAYDYRVCRENKRRRFGRRLDRRLDRRLGQKAKHNDFYLNENEVLKMTQ